MRFPSTVVLAAAAMLLAPALSAQKTITGQAAFADWNRQQPGVRRKITLADRPEPRPDEAVNNTPHVIPRPADAWPIALAGFKVSPSMRAATPRPCSERTTSRGWSNLHYAAPHQHRTRWRSLPCRFRRSSMSLTFFAPGIKSLHKTNDARSLSGSSHPPRLREYKCQCHEKEGDCLEI
jgi:hypothetical protein